MTIKSIKMTYQKIVLDVRRKQNGTKGRAGKETTPGSGDEAGSAASQAGCP